MRNQSLATPFLAKSSIISLVVAISLFAGATAMAGDPVYKWKDANGESHYSQQPPDGIKYETITTSGAPSSDGTDATASKPESSEPKTNASAGGQTPAQIQRQQLCSSARANVATLNAHATVTTDINGDGKPVTLNAAQHDSALNDANKQVGLYCSN